MTIVRSHPHFTNTDHLSLTSINTDVTLDNSADVWLVDGNTTVTLPLASTYPNRRFNIKRIGTEQVTIQTQSSDVLDGNTSLIIDTQYTNITVVCDGATNWYII